MHSHHPFLLGDTALRVAAAHNISAVFTYHTRYEYYTHYAPADSPRLKRLALDLALGYCRLCDAVIAPSESVAAFLQQHGVKVPVEVIPSGVNLERFANGNGAAARAMEGIPPDAFVVGHVGHLAPEKNLTFLSEVVARFLLANDQAHCLIGGDGPLRQPIWDRFKVYGLAPRLHMAGTLETKTLAGVYQAMNVFAFGSHTETQGMVLAEAMAAGVLVVALDAPGVREIVRNGINGCLLAQEDLGAFVAALSWTAGLDSRERQKLQQAARETAAEFSLARSIDRTQGFYRFLVAGRSSKKGIEASVWSAARRSLAKEGKILRNIGHAVGNAVLSLLREGGRPGVRRGA